MKFQMKKAALTLALVGTFGSAQAATVALNGSDFPYDLGADPTDANAYSVTHAPGSFSDVFTFSLAEGGDTISSAVSLFLPGINSEAASYNIINGTVSLFHDIDGDGVAGTNTELGSVDFGNSNGVLAVNDVAAGSYFWTVAGEAVGANGGLYLYAANTIPEPGTYAMMLAGLGLLGFMAKRRLEQTPSMGSSFGMA
jgi:hypothetical protein